MKNKALNIILHIFSLLLVGMIVLTVAYLTGLLTGNPKGVDTYAYLTKVKLILQYFPHINWNPFWDSGTPFFIWSYPPLSMVLVASMVKALGITPGQGLTIMAATSFVLLGWGIYGFVYQVVKSRLAALLTILVLASSPASWSWWNGGNYVRVFGLGMMGLALFLSARYLEAIILDQKRKRLYVLTVLGFGLVLMSHLLLGGVTLVLISLFFFFSSLSWRRKVTEFLKLFLPSFALAAYWYLPLFLTGKPTSRFIGRDPAFPINWRNFLSPSPGQANYSFSINVLPFLSLGLILLVVLLLIKKLKANRFQKGILLAWLMATLMGFLYNTIGHLPFYPETWYIIGFPPITAFSMFGIIAVIFGGLVLGIATKEMKRGLGLLILIGALGGAILGIWRDLPHLKGGVDDVLGPESLENLNQQVISVKYPFNFRFGTDNAFVSDWFNWKYDVYQTRDYFGQGIIYPNWQSWFETAVWYWEDNYPETKFLFDWYGVREFFVGNPHFKYQKFLNDPQDFSLANHKTLLWQNYLSLELYQFEHPAASPIFSARNTPVILVVGKQKGYDFFLRALAQAGLNSQEIIPIRGGEAIDRFNEEELGQFDGLVLYEYTYKNQAKAMKLLENYLGKGRTIFWETHGSPEEKVGVLSEILPIESFSPERIWDNWEIQGGENLKVGSKVLKKEGEMPLIVSWQKAGGKVIWSGLNLPFLIMEKKNEEEISLLKNLLIEEMIGKEEMKKVNFEADFPHPERREINIFSPAKGVLLKESYFSNWHAQVDQKKIKIYPAGPDLMYVFLHEGKGKVTFEYKISLLEKGSWLISILVLFGLLAYCLEGIFFSKGLVKKVIGSGLKPIHKLEKKISSWWEIGEE